MDETNEIIDDEDRVCEWAGCNQHYVGLEALVQHVNSVHVQVKTSPVKPNLVHGSLIYWNNISVNEFMVYFLANASWWWVYLPVERLSPKGTRIQCSV